MSNAITKLNELRQRKASELTGLRTQFDTIKNRFEAATHELRGIDASIAAIGHNGAGGTVQENSSEGEFTSMSLSPAILQAIALHGEAPGLLVPEIIGILHKGGFASQATKLYSTVYAASIRLVKLGKIAEGKKDGKR